MYNVRQVKEKIYWKVEPANFYLLLRMFASPEWLFMRLQEQVTTVFLPGFASASVAALVEFLRKGEVSVAQNLMEDFLMLVHLLEIFPPIKVC